MIIEKEFGKTFSLEKNEFVTLPVKTNLDYLEKLRYFQTQISLLESKINMLNQILSTGDYKAGQAEIDAIINELSKDFEKIKLKSAMIEMSLSNINEKYEKNINKIESCLSVSKFKPIAQKISSMETTYSSLTGKNSGEIFLNLVETVDILIHRTKNLEIFLTNIREFDLGNEVKKLKKEFQKQGVDKK